MNLFIVSLISCFLLVGGSCFCEQNSSIYACDLCKKQYLPDEYIIDTCFSEFESIHEKRKDDIQERKPCFNAFMPVFSSTHSWLMLIHDRAGLVDGEILFHRGFGRCRIEVGILKDSIKNDNRYCINESTAKQCGLVWDLSVAEPQVMTNIQCYGTNNEVRGCYNPVWYSSMSCLIDSLRTDIIDVYELSKIKLNELISSLETRIARLRARRKEDPDRYKESDYNTCVCKGLWWTSESCLNCKIKYTQWDLDGAKKRLTHREGELPLFLACLDNKKEEVRLAYQNTYENCLKTHKNPWTYYQRGLIHFEQGEWEKSLDDVLHLLKNYENDQKLDQLPPKVYFDKGLAESELELYHDAIQSLSYVIEKDPDNKEAHFERAVAYFEEGSFDFALKDYLASGIKPVWDTNTYCEYGTGFVEGIKKGIHEELRETLPIAIPIMSVGMWALTSAPSPHAKLISASMACVAAAALYMTADQMVTELRYMVNNWDQLSPQQQGSLCGYLIGKYGIDVFAVAGSAKMIEAYRNLKRANNMLTFELMLAPEHEFATLKTKFKGVEKYKQDRKYVQQIYGTKIYPDQEIRATLKSMGYEMPKRPDSIPKNFEARFAKGIGIRYTDPANHLFEEVRLMPGTTYSPNPAQQKPYIIHTRNGKTLNAKGEIVPSDAPLAHIPIEEFVFRQPT